MTQTQHAPAKTIDAIATGTDSDVALIANRAVPVDQDLVDQVIDRSQCGYPGRQPTTPAGKPTDMDLASYMLMVYRRSAVATIDGYTRLTPRTADDNARHIGDTRFGEVTGLVSHQQYLSFGLKLHDVSVIGDDGCREQVGQGRSFTLLAPNGDWHVPTANLSWRPREDEAQFNRHHGLTLSDIVTFVHRNRVQSCQGSAYLAAKCLLVRLNDAIAHFSRPTYTNSAPVITRHTPAASEIVPSFTMQLHGFELTGEYAQDICSHEHLSQLYAWRQLVQWLVRIDEYAFYLHGVEGGYTAPWVRGPQWQHTGEGKARLQLHPALAISYHLRYVSRATVAAQVPLAPLPPASHPTVFAQACAA